MLPSRRMNQSSSLWTGSPVRSGLSTGQSSAGKRRAVRMPVMHGVVPVTTDQFGQITVAERRQRRRVGEHDEAVAVDHPHGQRHTVENGLERSIDLAVAFDRACFQRLHPPSERAGKSTPGVAFPAACGRAARRRPARHLAFPIREHRPPAPTSTSTPSTRCSTARARSTSWPPARPSSASPRSG